MHSPVDSGSLTGQFCGVLRRDDVVLAAVEEEGGTGDRLDVHLVIVSLLRQPSTEYTHPLPRQRFDARKWTDQHHCARRCLVHQLEGDPGADGPTHDDDVLLFEAHPIDDMIIDVCGILFYGLAGRAAFVYAVAGVLHGYDIDLYVSSSYLIEIAQQVEHLMCQFDVLARGVQVEDEVSAAHHRVQKKTGDVFLDLFLFDTGGGFCGRLVVQLQSALGLEQGRVDGQMYFVGVGGLVAIEKRCE